MALIDDMRAAAARGGPVAATSLVDARAEAGDPEALAGRGEMRLWGLTFPQDLAGARADLSRAAALGHEAAIRTAAALMATGTGGPVDDEAARALTCLMPGGEQLVGLAEQLETPIPAAQPLSRDPAIRLVKGLIPTEVLDHVVAFGRPRVRPSSVIDPRTGSRIADPIRTSHGHAVAPVEEDVLLNAVNRRLHRAAGIDIARGEPLHLLRYAPGQEYRAHLDALPGAGNQRTTTVLLYLNDGYEGGETHFDSLDIHVRGQAGDALIFDNLHPDGTPDRRTRHCGLPVLRGEKWLATRWIRMRPVSPFEPATLR